jgi:hypothetical protein
MLFVSIRLLNRPIGWMHKDTRHERYGIFSTSGICGEDAVAASPSDLPLSRWTDNYVMLAPIL